MPGKWPRRRTLPPHGTGPVRDVDQVVRHTRRQDNRSAAVREFELPELPLKAQPGRGDPVDEPSTCAGTNALDAGAKKVTSVAAVIAAMLV